MYDETHFQYVVPVDTHLTDEAGDIQVQLSFYKVDMEDDGAVDGLVFKTTGCNIQIIPIENWQQFVPDKSLLGIDQKILKIMATEEAVKARQDAIEAYQAEIVEAMQNGLIDDENISELTTYSSKKIEEKFIDDEEVDEELEEREIGTKDIDTMFDDISDSGGGEPPSEMTDDDIDEMFGDDTTDTDNDNIINDNNENDEISNEEIDDLF